ncbi:hypothetical protein GCM10027081_45660 [Cupriavidus yeoncheonensis]
MGMADRGGRGACMGIFQEEAGNFLMRMNAASAQKGFQLRLFDGAENQIRIWSNGKQ